MSLKNTKINHMFNIFKNKEKRKVIADYRNKTINLISFENLSKFKIGEIVQMVDGVPNTITTTRIPSSDDKATLAFRVEMKKGYKWKPHFHDCYETIVVYKGECKDLISGKVANKGMQMVIKPNTVHEIECITESSIFYVEFTKTNI